MAERDEKESEQAAPTGVETDTIHEAALKVGRERMQRGGQLILVEGFIGGLYISVGALGAMAIWGVLSPGIGKDAAWFVASLLYPIGFIFVVFGRSELFTENFLAPVLDVWQGKGRHVILWRLLVFTLLGNLVGCFVMAYLWTWPLASLLRPESAAAFASLAKEQVGASWAHILLAAAIAGMLVNFMSWLLLATRGHGPKLVMVFIPAYLVMALHLDHSVVGSFENMVGILGGGADWGSYLRTWLPLTVLGNVLGGTVFVTVLHAGQAALVEKEANAP